MELVLDLLGSKVLSRWRLESSKLEPTPESEQEMHRDLRLSMNQFYLNFLEKLKNHLDGNMLSMPGGVMNDELKVFGINMLGTVAWLDEVVMLSHLSETAVDELITISL